jgi:hypothetical protein
LICSSIVTKNGNYSCEKCGRDFKQKSHDEKHQDCKTPCVKEEKIKEIVNKIVDEKLNMHEAITITTPNISLKPIVKWSGGKKDELKHIIPYLPDQYTTYLEPFIGGGAVYFHINPEKAVINDVHKELVDLYQSVKNGESNAIYEFMKNHPNNEETYYTPLKI